MKILIAIDSFKGSLSSTEAGEAVAIGIRRAFPNAQTAVISVADGGEGTIDAISSALGSKEAFALASDALGRRISCRYGITDNKTALIEISAAAGITLLKKDELNPMIASSYGVGEIINDALDKGCRSFIIGIGGSATNDGGVGMLQALGFSFLDAAGKEISLGAEALKNIDVIKTDNVNPRLKDCHFRIACDVTNPLCGETGCSYVFSPQKGATAEQVKEMDACLLRFAEKTNEIFPSSDKNLPGSGAAGGLGFAFRAYLGAELISGSELIISLTDAESKIKAADLVITGEGRLDEQTAMGKIPISIARLAKKHGKPVIAFSGAVAKDAYICNEKGIDAFFPVIRNISTLEEALNKEAAFANTSDTAEQVFRLIKALKA